ncbi:MAG: tRNA adenosine(34) deaminase TadA [Balneolaceae bacterium]
MFNGKKQDAVNLHQNFMIHALKLAEMAYDKGEVPIGAIVVKDGRMIGKGHNQTEMLKDPTAHAEMLAISSACATLNNKYLKGCTLYVTLEPCPMCAGAIVWSKIDRIVFGALDEKNGACGSIFNIASNKLLNHRPEVIHGILELDSELLLKKFFADKRNS